MEYTRQEAHYAPFYILKNGARARVYLCWRGEVKCIIVAHYIVENITLSILMRVNCEIELHENYTYFLAYVLHSLGATPVCIKQPAKTVNRLYQLRPLLCSK